MYKRKIVLALTFILFAGAALRLWGLWPAELVFDEGLYAFRSIGYLDYLDNAAQPTPVQWFIDKDLPWWTRLSFHDHPLLVFLIQHASFGIFGDSLFAARLPSALFGILSILLVYLVGRLIFKQRLRLVDGWLGGLLRSNNPAQAGSMGQQDEAAALTSAALFAVSFAAVGVSRLAMMESVSFFFILLNIYFFLRFLEDKKYWFFFGASFGLAFLTKYTAVFLAPAYFVFLIAYKPALFKSKYLYAAMLAAILIFSPVIVYNVYFYQAFGHFDLQFATLLGQNTPSWQGESGKTQEPFSNISENSLAIYSLPLLAAIIFGAAISAFSKNQFNSLLLIFLFFQTLMFLLMGSAIRFISLYIIPGVFLTAFGIRWLWEKFGYISATAALILVFVFEIMLTLNLTFLNPPNYGVVALDKYLDSVLKGVGRSAAIPRHSNPHLARVIDYYAAHTPETLPPTGIIYDENIDAGAKLWLFSRRQFYRGIPIMTAGEFGEKLKSDNSAMFAGYELYFVKAGPGAPLIPAQHLNYAEELEGFLAASGKIRPDFTAKSGDGQPAFSVYQLSLSFGTQ